MVAVVGWECVITILGARVLIQWASTSVLTLPQGVCVSLTTTKLLSTKAPTTQV